MLPLEGSVSVVDATYFGRVFRGSAITCSSSDGVRPVGGEELVRAPPEQEAAARRRSPRRPSSATGRRSTAGASRRAGSRRSVSSSALARAPARRRRGSSTRSRSPGACGLLPLVAPGTLSMRPMLPSVDRAASPWIVFNRSVEYARSGGRAAHGCRPAQHHLLGPRRSDTPGDPRAAGGGEATVNELAEPFAMSLPAVSKHLKVLERAGLITRGRTAQCGPAGSRPRPLEDATEWLSDPAVLGGELRPSRRAPATIQREPPMSDAMQPEGVVSAHSDAEGDPDRPGLRRAARAGLQGVDRGTAVRGMVRRARLGDPARQGGHGRAARRRMARHDVPRAGSHGDPVLRGVPRGRGARARS